MMKMQVTRNISHTKAAAPDTKAKLIQKEGNRARNESKEHILMNLKTGLA